MHHANDNAVLISLNEAAHMTSLSRTMLNRYRSEGLFPAAVPMGERRVAFVATEVRQWIQDKIKARRDAA